MKQPAFEEINKIMAKTDKEHLDPEQARFYKTYLTFPKEARTILWQFKQQKT